MHSASVLQPIVHAEDELQENGQTPRGPAVSSGGTATEPCVELMARSAAPGAAAACPTDTMAGMAIKTNAKIHIHFELFARVMSSDPFVKASILLQSSQLSSRATHRGSSATSERAKPRRDPQRLCSKPSIGSSRAIHAARRP